MNRAMEDVLNEKAPYGSAILWWLGQMGLLVKMGETVLCVDYFASGMPGRQVPPASPFSACPISPSAFPAVSS